MKCFVACGENAVARLKVRSSLGFIHGRCLCQRHLNAIIQGLRDFRGRVATDIEVESLHATQD